MSKLFLGVAFIIALVFFPWWVSMLCAIFFLSFGGNPLLVLSGGILLDLLYGTPLILGGAYLYTFYFGIVGILGWYLRIMLFE